MEQVRRRNRSRTGIGFSIAALATAFLAASSWAAPESLLIKNVHLVGQGGEEDDVLIEILIKQGRLVLVAKEPIPTHQESRVVDAREGFVVGALDLDKPANFIIVDEDPRGNIELLMDTRVHTRFAIVDGEVVSNTYGQEVPTETTEEEPEVAGTKYVPPVNVLPISYLSGTKWNHHDGERFSFAFLAAVMLDRTHWSQNDVSRQQVGDLSGFDSGEIRGLRIGAAGVIKLKRPLVYTFFAATHAFDRGFDSDEDDAIAIFDYRLDIPVARWATLSVGKQKEPISMERIMSLAYEPMQERSAVLDALLPSRNVGVVVNGVALNDRMTWAGGLFNDWFDAGESLSDSATQYIGRLTGLPFVREDATHLVHLGVGVRYSDAKQPLRFLTEPEVNSAPDFVDTGVFDGDSSLTLSLEASWRRGPYWVSGEYLQAEVDSPVEGNQEYRGHALTASWAITGEMRPYRNKNGIFDPLPIARPVSEGGWGLWEASIRWSELDLTDGSIQGGETGIYSVGVNWWLREDAVASLNWRQVELDRFGTSGTSQSLIARILLILD
jgi:phosphate-selective porin OprO/OprP